MIAAEDFEVFVLAQAANKAANELDCERPYGPCEVPATGGVDRRCRACRARHVLRDAVARVRGGIYNELQRIPEPHEGDHVLRLESLITRALQIVDGDRISLESLKDWAADARTRYIAGDLPRSVCSSAHCGRQIVWGINAEGKRVPLDPRPIIYAVLRRGLPGGVLVTRARLALVSHFATCPDAKTFSKAGGA
jgi:hypothetical protein